MTSRISRSALLVCLCLGLWVGLPFCRRSHPWIRVGPVLCEGPGGEPRDAPRAGGGFTLEPRTLSAQASFPAFVVDLKPQNLMPTPASADGQGRMPPTWARVQPLSPASFA